MLHGDSASEAFLSEIVGATAIENQRHMSMESLYEYGARAGFWRLHRLFTEREMPVVVFGDDLLRDEPAAATVRRIRYHPSSRAAVGALLKVVRGA